MVNLLAGLDSSFKEKIRIETDRFVLRVLKPEDASEAYSRWLDETDARRFIVASKSPHAVSDLKTFIQDKWNADDALLFGIFTRDGEVHIGNVKYEPLNPEEKFAVTGILIGEKSWRGRGVAAEVIRASSRWLKEHLGVVEVVLGVHKENTAAIKAYEKIGFVEGPTARFSVHEPNTAMTWTQK